MAKEGKRRYYKTKGSRISTKKVQAYGEELHRLQAKHKGVTAETVLDAASRSRSPLHGHFEWDDTRAAREHRLHEARKLIQGIEVRIEYVGKAPDGVPQTLRVRAFQHVSDDGGDGAYQTIGVIQSNDDYRQQIERRLASDLERVGGELLLYQHLKGYGVSVNGIAKKVRRTRKK